MNKINWGRLLVGGVVASIILFLTDGVLHEGLVRADWKAVNDALGFYDTMGNSAAQHGKGALVYFAVFELGRGFISIYLYALMRTCCGPGPKTAALAGVVAWIAFSVTGPAQFIPLGFYSLPLWIKVGAFQLVTSIVAAIAGAVLYKDVAPRP
jgi:hypothetical protein